MKSQEAQDALVPKETGIDPLLCRRFELSMPITSPACAIHSRCELRIDNEMMRKFKQLFEDELSELLNISKSFA